MSATALMGAAPTPESAPGALSAEDDALVRRATAYLDGLDTASGGFIQTTADGRQSAGTFWLQRPGRARFDYLPPSGMKIAADGHVVTVADERLGTIHSYPLGATPLSLFLARHIALDQGARVEAVVRTPAGFAIRVRGGRGKGSGTITLAFRAEPLSLVGWSVTDARGATVRVALTGFARSAPRPAAFFVLRAPTPAG
jgi:outer membrane lipoprotein-sorting protein